MKTYYLTSTKFTGEIELRYDDAGLLLGYDNRAQLDAAQARWFLGNMPRSLDELQRLIQAAPTAMLTETKQAVTFDMFWNKYDDKVNSSRKRTLAKWQKMPVSEQIKAFNYITKYVATIPAGIRKKYAEKYLNDELWNN